MKLTFLGTSAGAPTRYRNVAGLAVQYRRDWDLFDCGEATQHQVLRAGLSLAGLRNIFISHLHGDHVFGLFGLLSSRALAGGAGEVRVFGPLGLRDLIRSVCDATSTHLGAISVTEVDERGTPSGSLPDSVVALPLDHRVQSLAWLIQLDAPPPKLDGDMLRGLGLAPGPEWGRLQRGEAVRTPEGRVIRPEEVLAPAAPGARVVIAGDNRDPEGLLARSGAIDLLVHEATFVEADVERLGGDRGHSTAGSVARAAATAGIPNLILTHFSPRHHGDLGPIKAEARAGFGGDLHFADDLAEYALTGSELRVLLD